MTGTKITAILVLGALEALAIVKGIDGALFGMVVATIGGIAGYHIGVERYKRSKRRVRSDVAKV